jgi:hypothetical protein
MYMDQCDRAVDINKAGVILLGKSNIVCDPVNQV